MEAKSIRKVTFYCIFNKKLSFIYTFEKNCFEIIQVKF